jgi:hypothetical protein
MNERIRQITGQVLDELVPETWVALGYDKIKDIQNRTAELIIKECADILMKPEYVMNHPEELTDYNRGWVNGRLLGIEHIKEHFGVEE